LTIGGPPGNLLASSLSSQAMNHAPSNSFSFALVLLCAFQSRPRPCSFAFRTFSLNSLPFAPKVRFFAVFHLFFFHLTTWQLLTDMPCFFWIENVLPPSQTVPPPFSLRVHDSNIPPISSFSGDFRSFGLFCRGIFSSSPTVAIKTQRLI